MGNILSLVEFKQIAESGADVRVTLNKWAGSRGNGGFSDRLMPEDLGYACRNSPKRKYFRPRTVNLVFVRIGEAKYVFAAAARITADLGDDGQCGYEDATSELGLSDFARRLIVKDLMPAKNMLGTWAFKAARLNDLSVESWQSSEWSGLEWKGYHSVELSFSRLHDILESERYPEYKAHLEDVCGVYVLTDSKTGMAYVGSAYGKEGMAQRWNHYLDSGHGGNKLLVKLFKTEGIDYFRKNFTFRLIHEFPLGVNPEEIVAFESMVKRAIGSREAGYNAN